MTMEAWSIKVKPNLDWNHAWGTVPLNILARFFSGAPSRAAECFSATPVWIRGRTTERNLTVGFRVSFDGEDAAELRYSASSIARVWLNGEFLCYGPARGPHGTDRVDVIPLAGRMKNGRNVLAFGESAGTLQDARKHGGWRGLRGSRQKGLPMLHPPSHGD